jgi:thiosulfate reductase cytochrome b subunit
VQAALGFALYWPVRLHVLVDLFGGLMGLRQVHYILAWVFIAFTAAHLYLVLTQPPALTRSMVTGSYWRRANG